MIIHVVHGIQKFKIEVPESCDKPQGSNESETGWTVGRLKGEIEKITGLPVDSQRLIHRGRTIFGDEQLVRNLGIKENDKMMVLGRKPIPVMDETMRKLTSFELNTVTNIGLKIDELSNELGEFEKGFLPTDLQQESLQKLDKKLRGINEECMKALEFLDSFTVDQSNDANVIEQHRAKRKEVVKSVQALLQRHDELSEKLKASANA